MSKHILSDTVWSCLILSDQKNMDLSFEIVSAGDHWDLRMSKQILSDPIWSYKILSDPKNMDLPFEIVSAGDHWDLRMSKQILPLELMLGW